MSLFRRMIPAYLLASLTGASLGLLVILGNLKAYGFSFSKVEPPTAFGTFLVLVSLTVLLNLPAYLIGRTVLWQRNETRLAAYMGLWAVTFELVFVILFLPFDQDGSALGLVLVPAIGALCGAIYHKIERPMSQEALAALKQDMKNNLIQTLASRKAVRMKAKGAQAQGDKTGE